jgi:hypothetical protein
MANSFYTKTGVPSSNSLGVSSVIRSEFASLEAAFDKFPTLSGNDGKVLMINSGALLAVSGFAMTTGSITGVAISGAAGSFTTLEASGDITLGSPLPGTYNLTSHIDAITLSASPVVTGTWANLGSVTTVDINGGTLDGAVIGGASPAAGTFTTLSSTGNTTLGDASGDTLTVNAATWTMPNFVATTSLGTLTTGTTAGPAFVQTFTPDAAGGIIYRGNRQTVTTLPSANTIAEINGNFISVNHGGTGTFTLAEGSSSYYSSSTASTIVTWLGYNARAPGLSGGAVMTSWNGFYVSNPTSTSITNARGLYIPTITGPTTIVRAIDTNIAYSAASPVAYNLYIGGTAYNYIAAQTGIGGLPTDDAPLTLYKTSTSTSVGERALYIVKTANNASGSNTKAGAYIATNFGLLLAGTSNVPGIWVQNAASNAGTFTSVPIGFMHDLSMSAAANIGSAKAIQINTATNTGGGTLATYTGIDILAQTVGTTIYGIRSQIASAANRWNLYIDGTANNALAGNLRIGSVVAPTVALDVTGSVIVSGNTTLGDASGDTLTVNAGTWTIGANYTATRAAGALATSTQRVLVEQITFSGDAGGGTNARGRRFLSTAQGATNFTAAYGIEAGLTVTTTAGVIASAYAASFIMAQQGTGNSIGYASAVQAQIQDSNTGTIGEANNFLASAPSLGGGNVSSCTGLRVGNQGTSRVTNAYGVVIEEFTTSSSNIAIYSQISSGVNKWNLYVEGTANNSFAGFASFGYLGVPIAAVDTTSFATNIVTNTAATYTVESSDYTIIQTTAASTYTLPAAASFTGRILHIVTQFAGTVTSSLAGSVTPLAGGAAGTAILAATAGKWATLQSNGTTWVIIAAN